MGDERGDCTIEVDVPEVQSAGRCSISGARDFLRFDEASVRESSEYFSSFFD
jgi:hypothetical protein